MARKIKLEAEFYFGDFRIYISVREEIKREADKDPVMLSAIIVLQNNATENQKTGLVHEAGLPAYV